MTVVKTMASSRSGVARASLLIASVVFFVKITVSRSGSAPTNAPIVCRACSYAAVQRRALWPLPRCTLP